MGINGLRVHDGRTCASPFFCILEYGGRDWAKAFKTKSLIMIGMRDDRMREKQRKSWKRRIVSGLICLTVGWLVYVEAMNLIAWHYAKEWSRTHQHLALIPTPLTDTKTDVLTGLLIQKFDISVQVPWKTIERDQTTTSVAVMSFKDGGGLLIFDRTFEVDGAKIIDRKSVV